MTSNDIELFTAMLNSINMKQTGIKGDGDCFFQYGFIFKRFKNIADDVRKTIVEHIVNKWDDYEVRISGQCGDNEWCNNKDAYIYYMGKGSTPMTWVKPDIIDRVKTLYRPGNEERKGEKIPTNVQKDVEGKVENDNNNIPIIPSAKWGSLPEMQAFEEIDWGEKFNINNSSQKFKVIIFRMKNVNSDLTYGNVVGRTGKTEELKQSFTELKQQLDEKSPILYLISYGWNFTDYSKPITEDPNIMFLVHHNYHFTLAHPKEMSPLPESKDDSPSGEPSRASSEFGSGDLSESGSETGSDDTSSESGSDDHGVSSGSHDYFNIEQSLKQTRDSQVARLNNERINKLEEKFQNQKDGKNLTLEEAHDLENYYIDQLGAVGNLNQNYDDIKGYIDILNNYRISETLKKGQHDIRQLSNSIESDRQKSHKRLEERRKQRSEQRRKKQTTDQDSNNNQRPPLISRRNPVSTRPEIDPVVKKGGKKTRKLKKKTSKKKRKRTRRTKPKKKKN